jgi:hypothetical protein
MAVVLNAKVTTETKESLTQVQRHGMKMVTAFNTFKLERGENFSDDDGCIGTIIEEVRAVSEVLGVCIDPDQIQPDALKRNLNVFLNVAEESELATVRDCGDLGKYVVCAAQTFLANDAQNSVSLAALQTYAELVKAYIERMKLGMGPNDTISFIPQSVAPDGTRQLYTALSHMLPGRLLEMRDDVSSLYQHLEMVYTSQINVVLGAFHKLVCKSTQFHSCINFLAEGNDAVATSPDGVREQCRDEAASSAPLGGVCSDSTGGVGPLADESSDTLALIRSDTNLDAQSPQHPDFKEELLTSLQHIAGVNTYIGHCVVLGDAVAKLCETRRLPSDFVVNRFGRASTEIGEFVDCCANIADAIDIAGALKAKCSSFESIDPDAHWDDTDEVLAEWLESSKVDNTAPSANHNYSD